MAIKYVSNADGRGWLVVKHSDGSLYPPLPQYLSVDVFKTVGGREYFRILEGLPRIQGREASVSLNANGGSRLWSNNWRPSFEARLRFTITNAQAGTGELWYGDWTQYGPIKAKTDPSNPPPSGLYDIEIPDEVHPFGEGYLDLSPFATTWFRIGHWGDRFIHLGRISAGCITVDAQAEDRGAWSRLYDYLINRRKDNRSVGTVRVQYLAAARPLVAERERREAAGSPFLDPQV